MTTISSGSTDDQPQIAETLIIERLRAQVAELLEALEPLVIMNDVWVDKDVSDKSFVQIGGEWPAEYFRRAAVLGSAAALVTARKD